MCFGRQGDVYIVNVLSGMILLKHLSLDMEMFEHLRFSEPSGGEFYMIFGGETVSVWKCPIEQRQFDISTICDD